MSVGGVKGLKGIGGRGLGLVGNGGGTIMVVLLLLAPLLRPLRFLEVLPALSTSSAGSKDIHSVPSSDGAEGPKVDEAIVGACDHLASLLRLPSPNVLRADLPSIGAESRLLDRNDFFDLLVLIVDVIEGAALVVERMLPGNLESSPGDSGSNCRKS